MNKDVKRIPLVFLFSLLCIICLSCEALAAEESCLTVSDYGEGCIITDCSQDSTGDLIIPEKIDGRTVIRIGEKAFEKCKGLTSITIPDTVVEIEEKAFSLCTSLESVNLTNSVKSLGDSAFSECHNLKNVCLSDNLTSIGKETFYFCKALESVNLPSGLKLIGERAFFGCVSLESIVLPEGTTSIFTSAFSNCSALESVYLPLAVEFIGKDAFGKCSSLSTVYFEGDEKAFSIIGIDSGNEMLTGVYPEYNHKHIDSASVVTVEPGCTTEGYSIYNCPCGVAFKGDYVSAEGHKLTVKTVLKAADCTTTGLMRKGCSDCDYYKNVTIKMKEHTEKTDKAVKATCLKTGKTKGSHCSVCGTVIKKQETVPKTEHKYSAKIKDKKHLASKATYRKAAKYYYSCSYCGKINKNKTFYGEKLVLPDIKKLTFTSTQNSVKLSWRKVDAAKGYAVYKKASDSGWKLYETVKTNTLKLSGLSAGSSFDFAVRAYVIENGVKVYSPKYVSVTVATEPQCPSKISATQNTTTITLNWNKSKGATGYRVYKYDNKNNKWVVVCSKTKECSFIIRELEAGVTCYFSVKAYTDTGKQLVWGEKSKTFTASTRPESPEVKATSYKAVIKLDWKKVDNADGYIVYFSENPSSGYRKVATTDELSFKKEGLVSGKTYYFKVFAYKKLPQGNVNSYASAVKKAKTR